MRTLTSLYLFTLLSVVIYACDTPQNTRRGGNRYTNSTSSTFSPVDSSQEGNFGSNSENSQQQDTASPNQEPGYETCNLSPYHSSSIIGHLGICQNKNTETELRVHFTQKDNGTRTCIVPTNKQTNGSSSYLGRAICSHHQANQTYKVVLTKDRPGSQNFSLNGAMILKQGIMLDKYFECMDAYNDYLSKCYNHPNICQQGAQEHQANLCNSFKSQYNGQYIDIAL